MGDSCGLPGEFRGFLKGPTAKNHAVSRPWEAVGRPCAKDAALSRWLIEVRALPGASYAAFSGLTHHVRAGIRPRVNRFKWTICRKFSKSGVIRLIRIYDGMNLP